MAGPALGARPRASPAGEPALEPDRPDAFHTSDLNADLRAVFHCSYRTLPPEAARAFRLLDHYLDTAADDEHPEPGRRPHPSHDREAPRGRLPRQGDHDESRAR
ncbi:hypothetical protein [Saccharothrix obliqua]|uniref:hypothetical protein n=1 Tax=Saccharothrix obliqua TaxID=2861747 RepID=UPI001C5D38D1|nr:hypothetical protein [Saccharothrix obliqua]MBW4717231.1 hypothetical protein [Saccharothrix obliqua]